MTLSQVTTIMEKIGIFLESKYHNETLIGKEKQKILENYNVSEKAFDRVFLYYCNPNRGTKYKKRRQK
jgi:hypothetical protein